MVAVEANDGDIPIVGYSMFADRPGYPLVWWYPWQAHDYTTHVVVRVGLTTW